MKIQLLNGNFVDARRIDRVEVFPERITGIGTLGIRVEIGMKKDSNWMYAREVIVFSTMGEADEYATEIKRMISEALTDYA
jgi:hypothetical protein